MDHLKKKKKRRIRKEIQRQWDAFIMALFWVIWDDRNRRNFQNNCAHVHHIVLKIDALLAFWTGAGEDEGG